MSDSYEHTIEPPSVETLRFARLDQLNGAKPLSFEYDIPNGSYTLKEHKLVETTRSGRKAWNGVEHYHLNFEPALYGSPCYYLSGSGSDQVASAQVRDPQTVYLTDTERSFGAFSKPTSGLLEYLANGSIVDPANLDDLIRGGLGKTLPYVKTELSSLNSLYELKDFKTMSSLALQTKTNLLKAARSFKILAISKSSRMSRSLKYMAKASGENYLSWKFALAPLISDINGLHRALKSYRDKVDNLVRRQLKWQTCHWSFAWGEESSGTQIKTVAPSLLAARKGGPVTDGVITYYRELMAYPAEFHFEIEYYFFYSRWELENARVRGLQDALGFNLNPQIIWNAIPFSFLVDYVIGVNQWLSRFKALQLNPRIGIRRCLWSIKRKRHVILSARWGQGLYHGIPLIPPVVPLGGMDEVAYKRSTFIPSVGSLQTSGLSSSEFSIVSALIATKRR